MTAKLRQVRSRGHTYLQVVEYHWDPIKKRGITHVLRHLGPMEPERHVRQKNDRLKFARAQIRQQRARWRLTKRARKEARRGSEDRQVYPALTPGPDLIEKVYSVICRLEKGGSRSQIFQGLIDAGDAPNEDERDARTHVGFAVTLLKEAGRIRIVRGSGLPRDPFVYVIGAKPALRRVV